MKSYLLYLKKQYKLKGLLIDTNIFLLYFIGNYNLKYISEFKRTQVYTIEDFVYLKNFIKYFKNKVITTPNILTEVSNLSETFNKQQNYNLFPSLSEILESISELNFKSINIIDNNLECFSKFGLSDTVSFELSKANYLVLTDDLPFYDYLASNKLPAMNFNHIRSEFLLGKG